MKNSVLFLTLIVFAIAPQLTKASSVNNATIEYIEVLQQDRAVVKLDDVSGASLNAQGDNGNCITSTHGTFIIELSSETGKAQYALLLSAQAQGKSIWVGGYKSCLAGREKINWLRLIN